MIYIPGDHNTEEAAVVGHTSEHTERLIKLLSGL